MSLFRFWQRRRCGVKALPLRIVLGLEILEDRTLLSGSTPVNPIVAENQLPGAPESQWDIQYSDGGAGDPTIQGFATDISVNHGSTINFKINDTQNAPYHIDIYRFGYYQGDGARLITTIPTSQTLDVNQPAPLFNSTTGEVDAGNWSVTASWAVPANAVSGVYEAHVIRDDTGGDSQIIFVVRDDNDATPAPILFQTDDSTWQAYNDYGGNSLYTTNTQYYGRAFAVSYNRPFNNRTDVGVNFFFDNDYPMIRWLESNGYDVSYFTDVDADRYGSQILQHQSYITAGHDEYWSANQRSNVQAALADGVNLAFLSGNDVFWKTYYANSIDGSNTPDRTLVTYKETWTETLLDPETSQGVWTGTWRDPTFSPPLDGGQPENALTGTLWMVNGNQNDSSSYHTILVPAQYAALRYWRNTAIANLQPGQTYTLPQGVLGFEWNVVPDNGVEPPGGINLSSTTLDVSPNYVLNYGTITGSGTATNHFHLYRDQSSGALVFSAGTVDYAWGLDSNHDFNGVMNSNGFDNDMGDQSDVNLQQATVNLLSDMGVQPGSLRPGLVLSIEPPDKTPPTSTITSLSAGATLLTGTPITITGTATASGGGVVAGVEISVDGGQTWHPTTLANAVVSTPWSYTWTPSTPGPALIETRAVNDSGYLETPSDGKSVTVILQGFTLFSPAAKPSTIASDTNAVELGVKFTSDTTGSISGIRFYRGPLDSGPFSVHLWSASGQLLASATAVGTDPLAGWQQVNFSSPVAIQANTTYIASYFAPDGNYAEDANYFNTAVNSGPLHAPSTGTSGGNGVYAYGGNGTFPTQTYSGANYWVDVVMTNPTTTNPIIYSVGPVAGANRVGTMGSVSVTFNKAMNPATLTTSTIYLSDPNGNVVAANVSYDTNTETAFLTPTAPLAADSSYTLTVLGGSSGAVVKDSSGNPLASTFTSSFFTDGPSPVVQSTSPSVGASGVSNGTTVSVTFSDSINPTTLTASTFYLKDANGNTLTATINYNPATLTATLTTRNFLLTSTTYTATLVGASIQDVNGRSLGSNYSWSFTTSPQAVIYPNLFRSATAPQNPLIGDSSPVEVGVKFYSTLAGVITGLRFYKGAGNTGTHVGDLWNSSGQLLASATFTNETASGWQQVNLAHPVLIQANTTYIASYWSSSGYFAADQNYFATLGVDGSPLHAAATGPAGGNGVFAYSSQNAFPNQTSNASNYWVDVVFQLVPQVISTSPASGAGRVSATAPVTVTFSEAMDASTINANTVLLTDPNGNDVAATVSYNSSTLTATLTPNAALNPDVTYTASVLGGSAGVKDQSENALLSTYSWSFLTDGPAPTVNSTSPSAGQSGVATTASVSVTFSDGMNAATLTPSTILLEDAGSNVVPATIAYNPSSNTVTLTPINFFATSATYSVTVVGGSSGVQDLNGRSLAANYSFSFTTNPVASPAPSLWRPNAVPQTISSDSNSVELGMKFTSAQGGYITGIRFYKGAGNSGTHVGNLWSISGQLLATATFTNETASGWQQVNFSSPVAIQANTTYVASYFAPIGHYGDDVNYFYSSGVTSYPLSAPSSAAVNGNGVYAYGASSSFPNQSYASSNYWVDVVYAPAPTVVSTSPASGAGRVSATAPVTVTFSEAMDASTINANTVLLTDPNGNNVAATVSYNSSTLTATLTPSAALNPDVTYTASVLGGSAGVKDQSENALLSTYSWSFLTDGPAPTVNSTSPSAGQSGVATTASVSVTFSDAMNAATLTPSTLVLEDAKGNVVPATVTYNPSSNTATLTPIGFFATSATYSVTVVSGSSGVQDLNGRSLAANYSFSFTTNAQPSFYPSLWRSTATPQNISGDSSSVEVGVKFTSTEAGSITGIRFYKGAGNSGTHIGNLWSSSGQLLATATFTNETASGWQQVNFSSPVAIQANTIYVASYFAPIGHYADDLNYFTTSGVNSYPLSAPSSAVVGGNGVYVYGSTSAFPTQTYDGANYWVDVVFGNSPLVTAVTPANGATGVSTTSSIRITFDRAIDPTTINSSTIFLTLNGNVIPATLSYDPATYTIILTPEAPLQNASTYALSLMGGSSGSRVKDSYGNYLATTFTSSFTTA